MFVYKYCVSIQTFTSALLVHFIHIYTCTTRDLLLHVDCCINMKIILLTSLLALTITVAVSATCTYDQSSNKISCRGLSHLQYRRSSTGWKTICWILQNWNILPPWQCQDPLVQSLPQKSAGGYWDYYTKVSEIGCRGGLDFTQELLVLDV